MAFTLNQLAAIEGAIASGTLKITYDGKIVEYRNMADLLKARDLVRGDLTAAGLLSAPALTNRGPATVAVFNRG
jgi:roadblock/LC7 domain-containing protein